MLSLKCEKHLLVEFIFRNNVELENRKLYFSRSEDFGKNMHMSRSIRIISS